MPDDDGFHRPPTKTWGFAAFFCLWTESLWVEDFLGGKKQTNKQIEDYNWNITMIYLQHILITRDAETFGDAVALFALQVLTDEK